MSRLPSEDRLSELAKRVASRTGFDLDLLGDTELRRVVRRVMSEQRFDDADACVAHLLKNESAFEDFLQELVVPETWFFRDREPFHCLRKFLDERWRPQRAGQRLRVLSIPCSTGEEPYSMAMILLDAGLTPDRFSVDAADISSRLLKRARQAEYGKRSFRGDEEPFAKLCSRYLDRMDGDRHVPGSELRQCVRFVRGNLTSPRLLVDEPGYHVIFCRNVMIYLHPEARAIALQNLGRLLLPEGLLYTGHVESRLVSDSAFRPFDRAYPSAFSPATAERSTTPADVRTEPSEHAASAEAASRKHRSVHDGHVVRRGKPTKPSTPRVPSHSPSHTPVARQTPGDASVSSDACGAAPTGSEMADAQRAADSGQLDQAQRLCQKVLDTDPAHVGAWFLMALMAQAAGKTMEAEDLFRRVLYLDQQHHGALIQMMLLAERRSDSESAARFRRRAELASRQETGE